MLSLIVAIAQNNVIGKDNKLVWHLPADLRYFKNTTMGHTLIMGRKTFESFGKPLPGRKSIVITRQKDWQYEGVSVVHSLQEAIGSAPKNEEVFIVGGAEIYHQAMPFCQKMYITVIHHDFDGDTYFPPIDFSQWKLMSDQMHMPDEKNPWSYSFRIFERIPQL
jgi:dihydrofolate reductase